MKKLLFLVMAIICSSMAFAQSDTYPKPDGPKYFYCEIMGEQALFSPKLKIHVDFGQARRWIYTDQRLVDENGEFIEFSSMVDALNYFSAKGWEYVESYVVTVQKQNVIHWLIRYDISKLTPEELEKFNKELETSQMVKDAEKAERKAAKQ